MDILDLRILARMGLVPWTHETRSLSGLSPSTIAAGLDVTPETVRTRIQAMEEAGVIQGYEVYPRLAQLGYGGAGVVLEIEDPDAKQAAIEELLLLDGVLQIIDFIGPPLIVAMAYQTDSQLERRLALMGRRTGDREPELVSRTPVDPPESRLSPLDWRILAALRGDAKRPLAEVGEEVGVSYRTVKRHVDRMAEAASATFSPRIEPGRISGVLAADLFIELADDAPAGTRRALKQAVGERFLGARASEFLLEGYHDLLVAADNMVEVETMRRRVSQVQGVEQVRAIFTQRNLETDWLDDRIQAELAKAEAGG